MQDKINQDVKAAMLAGERDKVETLKMVKSALQMAAIENKGDLSDEAALKVLQKEAKKRLEAAEMYAQAGDATRANKETAEAELIKTYLPAQMSESEIAEQVDAVIAEQGEAANLGQVMGAAMKRLAGQADGGTVSKIVKQKLGQ